MSQRDSVSTRPAAVPPPRAAGVLNALVAAAVVALAAGTPLSLPVAGRTLPIGPTSLVVLAMVATLPFWLRGLPRLNAFTACAALFIVWAWASAVFWSVDYRRSVLTATTLLEAMVVFVAAWHVVQERGSRGFSTAIRVLNLILVVQIVWVLTRLIGGGASGFFSLKSGVQLPLGASNYLAIFLEFGLLYELLARRRGWIVFAALDGAGILLTFSRGALVATGTMLVVCAVVLLGSRGQRRTALLALGALGVGAIVLVFTPAIVVAEAMSAVQRSVESRFSLWRDAWEAAAWRPFTGIGYGAYQSLGSLREAHSLPLGVLAETGVVGLVLVVGAVFGALGRAARAALQPSPRRAEALGVAAGLAVVLIHSLFEPFFAGRSAIWAAMVFAWISGPWADRAEAATATGVPRPPPSRT